VKLSAQELNNIWRKKALRLLIEEVHNNFQEKRSSKEKRVNRFLEMKDGKELIKEFRESIGYAIPPFVPNVENFVSKLETLAENKKKSTFSRATKTRSITF